MNDDFRNSSIDLELQVRLMNLVMGEASDFERDQLQALMEQRPELAAYCEHVEHLHGLLNEAAIGDLDQFSKGEQISKGDKLTDGDESSRECAEDEDSPSSWQLSSDRRIQLLAVLDGAQLATNNEKVCLSNKKPWWSISPRRAAEFSVVIACLFVAIGLLRPSVQTSQQTPVVLSRKYFDSTGATNWSFNPATVQRGSNAMPADGTFYGEYFNAPSQEFESLYRSSVTKPSSGSPLGGIPSDSFAVQETVVSPKPSVLFFDQTTALPDIDQRFSTSNRGREKFLAEGKSASPSNQSGPVASGPVASGKTSGGAGPSSQNIGSQVLAERELVELRKSTTLDALSVTNEPLADLPAVKLESKDQVVDFLAVGEGGSTNETGVQLNNFSKRFSIQSNGIDATEKSVQETARPQGDSSAGDVTMLGRIAAGQADDWSKPSQEAQELERIKALADEPGRVNINTLGDVAMLGAIADEVKSKSNQQAEGLERSKALADLGTRVDSNRSEVFFDRTAGSESNRGGKPGAKADGEARDRFSASPSTGKSAEQSDFMAWMDAGLPLTITPDAIAAQDKNPRLPAAEDDGAQTIVGLAPGATSNNPFPFTTNLDAVFDKSNTIGAAPFGGVAGAFKAPATSAPAPSAALGFNSIHDFERPQVYQLQDERKAQNQVLGRASEFERFSKEQPLKQQSGGESSSLSNYSILEDAFKRREKGLVDALRGVEEAPVVSPDAQTWKALSNRRKERYGQVVPNTNYFAESAIEALAAHDEKIDPSDSPVDFMSPSTELQAKSVESLEEFIVPSDASGLPAEPRSGESMGKAISPERLFSSRGSQVQQRGGEALSKGKSDAKEETVAEKLAKKSYLEASKDSAPEVDVEFDYADATLSGEFVPAKEPPAAFKLHRPANDELSASSAATSTFSLHVSDVSFKLAQAALQQGQMPDASKIRIEEFVNALDYRDPLPDRQEKVSCTLEQAVHPFLMQRNLLRISMRTATAGRTQSTPLRLTILLDNSGSMERPDRRQAVLRAFQTLTQQLTDKDQVTLISFANTPRLLADKVAGNQGESLLQLVESLPSEGGTNIESALMLAREKALEQRLDAAQNRIVLMTDGAVNLGDADPTSLSKLVVQLRESGIAFDAAGICSQDLNDEVLESLTRQGDGRYYLLDSPESIGEDFAAQIAGALRPSAKNVKVQVEFNPQRVGKYKLLGFEKHRLNQEDFRNDSVDAAELAAAEAGVAVYQIQPIPGGSGDIGSVSVRFRDIATGQMIERRWPIVYGACTNRFDTASPTIRLAGTAAMLATKFAGGAQADQVDLAQLKNFIAALPEALASQQRTQQLRTMIDQARQIAGE